MKTKKSISGGWKRGRRRLFGTQEYFDNTRVFVPGNCLLDFIAGN